MKRGHVLVGLVLGVLMALFGSPAFLYWDDFKDTGVRLLSAVVGLLGFGLTISSIVALFRIGEPIFAVRFEPTLLRWGRSHGRSTSVAYGEIAEFSTDFSDVTLATIRFTLVDRRHVALKAGNFSGVELEHIRSVLESRSGKRDQSR